MTASDSRNGSVRHLAWACLAKDGVLISGAARGSVENTVQAEETSMSNTAWECGFDFAVSRSCAPWPADTSNPLIGIFSNAWKKVTGAEMSIAATHAGLECGWFSQKAPTVNIVTALRFEAKKYASPKLRSRRRHPAIEAFRNKQLKNVKITAMINR